QRHPAPWHVVRAALVEKRDDLALEQVEERASLNAIPIFFIRVFFALTNRPADAGRIRLVPPAVQDADVERAVERGLHAARATGLERASGRVEPAVNALHGAGGGS